MVLRKTCSKLLSTITLILLFNCQGDDVVDLSTIPVLAAYNVVISDSGNSNTSADIEVSFDITSGEKGISEYRIVIVKSGVVLTLDKLAGLVDKAQTKVMPIGANQTLNLGADVLDSDGDAIADGNCYQASIVSVADDLSAGVDAISVASEESCLKNALDEMRALIKSEMGIWNINALALAAVKDGQIIWTEGFGVHDVTNQIPTTENTLFATSSIAKLVVAVAVMQQVEQGKLDLDEDVGSYLGYELRNPNFPEIPITSRQLMTQRASLALPTFAEVPDLAATYTPEGADELPFETWIPDYLVQGGANFSANVWKNYSPDTQHASSNVGMAILAHLVEKVTGTDFRDYAEDKIFIPLGMTHSSYRMDMPGSYDDAMLADIFTSTGSIFVDYMYRVDYPAGLLRTSAKEWSNFLIAILNGGELNGQRILEKATIDQMLDVKYPDANLAYGSGVALIWRSLNGWIGHTAGGFVTGSTDINIESGSGVVIFSNGRGALTVVPDSQNGKIYDAIHSYILNK